MPSTRCPQAQGCRAHAGRRDADDVRSQGPLRSGPVLRRLRRSRAARRDHPPAHARGGRTRRPQRRHGRPAGDGRARRRRLRAARTVARGAAHPRPERVRTSATGARRPRRDRRRSPGSPRHHELRGTTALEPARTTGDPQLIERLVANLVANAVRHNIPGGRLDVATYTAAGRATFTIANTGPVIPTGELTRLFQPFQRLSSHPGPSATGSGSASRSCKRSPTPTTPPSPHKPEPAAASESTSTSPPKPGRNRSSLRPNPPPEKRPLKSVATSMLEPGRARHHLARCSASGA